MLIRILATTAILLFSLMVINCTDQPEEVICLGELEITFMNQRSEDVYISFISNNFVDENRKKIEFMDSTMICQANNSIKNVVFYSFNQFDNCKYNKDYYEDVSSIAEIYLMDSILIATHNLYPYDTVNIEDDVRWGPSNNPMLYRDTIIIPADTTETPVTPASLLQKTEENDLE